MNFPKNHIESLRVNDLIIAAEAALRGAAIILSYWDNPPALFCDKEGSHYELVSEADHNADAAIQLVIKSAFPDDKILSEELSPDTTDVRTGRCWIIDPLDGTSAFLFKCEPALPSVMIALVIDGEPAVSVVAQPMIKTWTYAAKGIGAFVNGERATITEPLVANLRNAWVDMNMYGDASCESDMYKAIDAFVRSPLGARLVTRRAPHSAVALGLLEAAGSRGLQACVHDHNTEKPKQLPWDIVPIQLIVEEAGGVYMDTGKGVDARLDPFDLQGPILIGPRAICQYIIDQLT